MPDFELKPDEKALIEKYGLVVSAHGDHFVVRDPQNKRLGGKGRIESGNLLALLHQAVWERENASDTAPTSARTRGPTPTAPRVRAVLPAPPERAAEPFAAPRSTTPARRKSSRDTSKMDAVYTAVIDGIAPNTVNKYLAEKGMQLKSSGSVYTHAAIAARVVRLMIQQGWQEPPKEP